MCVKSPCSCWTAPWVFMMMLCSGFDVESGLKQTECVCRLVLDFLDFLDYVGAATLICIAILLYFVREIIIKKKLIKEKYVVFLKFD